MKKYEQCFTCHHAIVVKDTGPDGRVRCDIGSAVWGKDYDERFGEYVPAHCSCYLSKRKAKRMNKKVNQES